jgi:hypothetical protein
MKRSYHFNWLIALITLNAYGVSIDGKWYEELEGLPSYYCVASKSTGFAYNWDRSDWTTSTFETSAKLRIEPLGLKYLEGEHLGMIPYRFTVLPSTTIAGDCENGFSKEGELVCDGKFYHLTFSSMTNRFLLVFKSGYWNVPKGKDRLSDTPALIIGECSRAQ